MVSERTRRGVLAAALAGTTAATAAPRVRSYLRQFAPLSGTVWDAADRSTGGRVESPYGDATVRRDDYGVPHVEAGGEHALCFAVGYVQGVDRLFAMDLVRRQLRGQLSAVAGEATLESDRFHVQMDFAGAAEANLELLEGTETASVLQAYVDGVNAAREREALPLEFRLLEYEPAPWTVADVMLVEKAIGWTLTGSFGPLRREVLAEELGPDATDRLYPTRMDHEAPILRERELASGTRDLPGDGATSWSVARGATAAASSASGSANSRSRVAQGGRDATTGDRGVPASRGTSGRSGRRSGGHRVGRALAAWASQFESPDGVGSNSWIVGGEHTSDGRPILANDPHLSLQAPPVWYEQHLACDAFEARGVAFPGAPFVVIGENHAGAWGVTNAGVDVTDHYTYETDGEQYRYGDEWRAVDREERTIEVDGASDRTVAVRKTVHGPLVEEAGQEVAVAWTGLSATETIGAVRELAHGDGLADAVAAIRRFDLPTQNFTYVDDAGNALYWVTGRIPIRRTGGEPVRGDRVFDGSEREGEWAGFEPYGVSSWAGFVPFEDKPGVVNPDYVATANQRLLDDPEHYLAEGYGTPFRGARAYERLDAAVADGSLTLDDVREIQQDTLDRRARLLVPDLLDVRGRLDGQAAALVEDLDGWDYRMDRGSRGALAFVFVLRAFRELVFEEPFADRDLDPDWAPDDWVLLTLPADDPWFDRDDVPAREDALVAAAERAAAEIDDRNLETYGDYNRPSIEHPFGVDFLGYDTGPTDGSAGTLRNVRVESDVGSSWVMIATPGGPSRAVLPGGNSGDYFSAHYDDQLALWLDGEYLSLDRALDEDSFATFVGGEDR